MAAVDGVEDGSENGTSIDARSLSATSIGLQGAPSLPIPVTLSHVTKSGAWLIVLMLSLVAFDAGIRIRQAIWKSSENSLRFMGDVKAGWTHGQAVLERARIDAANSGESVQPLSMIAFARAYRSTYDDVVEDSPDRKYGLDYTPLRLLVMSAWVMYIDSLHPGVSEFRPEFVQPLLVLNTVCALVAAIVAAIIVLETALEIPRHGAQDESSTRWPKVALVCVAGIGVGVRLAWRLQPVGGAFGCIFGVVSLAALLYSIRKMPVFQRALASGFLASQLIWFNPAILLDAHAWPQWDVWPVPFVLLSILCIMQGWALPAGVCFAIGAMLKGQMLLVSPLFILWPLFSGRYFDAVWVTIGGATAVAGITSIWLVQNGIAWTIVSSVTGTTILVLALFNILNRKERLKTNLSLLPITCAIFSASVFLVGWRCGGSFSWLEIGFRYGTEKFDNLHQRGTYNLATILADDYGWKLHDSVTLQLLDSTLRLELKTLLILCYAVSLACSSIVAGLVTRRNDPNLFIALTAPFVLFYSILGQMHSRYLLFGAAVSSLCVAVGSWGTVLSLSTTVLATLPILQLELIANDETYPGLRRLLASGRFFFSCATLMLALGYMSVLVRIAWRCMFSAGHYTAITPPDHSRRS